MPNDAELLHQYAVERSDGAFVEFVRRHIDFVYASALRLLGGDAHHASDVTQHVFNTAARKAGTLAQYRTVKGWLYLSTRNAAANLVRAERLRRRRETEAHALHAISAGEENAGRDELQPMLDAALSALNERDREVVFLRFFEGQSYPEIAGRFATTADAARQRLDRALEKMRQALAHRGIASTTAALSGALTTQAAVTAPTGLVTTVSASALTAVTAGGALGFFAFMGTTKVGLGLAGVIALGGIGIALQQRVHAKLENQLAAVRRLRDQALEHDLAVRASPNAAPVGNDAELTRLTAEATALRQRLAEAPAVTKAPAEPPMRTAGEWANRGNMSPEAALETIFWATREQNHAELGKILMFAPGDRGLAEALWSRIPEDVRAQGRVASAEELIAMTWADHHQLHFDGLRVETLSSQGPDDAVVSYTVHRSDHDRVETQTMQFHRGADGWRWIMPTDELEHTTGEAVDDFRSVLKPHP